MKRIINFRPIAFSAIGVILGAILCSYYPYLGVFVYPIVGVSALIFPFIIKLLCFDTPFSKIRVASFAFFIAMLVGFSRVYFSVDNAVNESLDEDEYTISGVVSEKSVNGGSAKIRLCDCFLGGESVGDISLYTDSEVRLYDVISAKCRVKPVEITDEEGIKYSYNILSGISSYSQGVTSVKVIGKSDSIFSKIKIFVDEALNVEKEEKGGVIAALFTGDTGYLDSEELKVYRLGGIAHVFAVSGMHVGMLYIALGFIFRKNKGKRLLKSIIISLILILYSGTCGFSASSLRAAIMFIILGLSDVVGEKGDSFNAISFACIVVCLIFPTEIFGMGFALSFSIALSLVFLAPTIKRKINYNEKISSVLSGTLSAQLVAYPMSVNAFGYFPIVGIITNFFIVPVVSIIYYMIWIAFILSAILPVIRPITLFLPNMLIVGVDSLTAFLSGMKLYIDFIPPIIGGIYYAALALLSDGVNVSAKIKRASVSIIGVCMLVSVVFSIIK